jgi:hypothetical protein
MPGKKSKGKFEIKAIEHCLQQCGNSDIRDILKVAVVAAKQAGAILLELSCSSAMRNHIIYSIRVLLIL